LVYYLLLQDRIEEAIKVFKKIQKEEIDKSQEYKLQFDYCSAYMNFYTGFPEFKEAREICQNYYQYPVLSWRNLFIEIANQLSEYDGEDAVEVVEEIDSADKVTKDKTEKNNLENAEKEEYHTIELLDDQIVVTYKNLTELTINLYSINLEILFSRNPFIKELAGDFAFVKPNYTEKLEVKKSSFLEKLVYKIPGHMTKTSMFVQSVAPNKVNSVTYFSTSLKVQFIESYGQVKISNTANLPLAKVYVKCFAKTKSGVVNFYKDGYTNLRGRFDYALTNAGDVNNIERFSVLIMSDEFGSLIKEVDPPSTVGKFEGSVVLKTKNIKKA
jgi:hypothetical protein